MSLGDRSSWAERLGILPLITRRVHESDTALDIRRQARENALRAVDIGRMRTALGKVEDFVRATARAPLFLDPGAGTDTEMHAYNSETLDALATYIARRGSSKKGAAGKAIQADGIQATVAVVRQLRELGTRVAVVDASVAATQGWKYRTMRRDAGVSSGQRQTKRAMRAAYLQRAVDKGFDRVSAWGRRRWAAALVGHNALLRGGELGWVEGRQHGFDAGLDMTFRSITWCLPSNDSKGRLWFILWVVPIKYRAIGNQQAYPIPIVRRCRGARGSDPLCPYDAMVIHWTTTMGSEPVAAVQDWQGRLAGGRLEVDHPMASQPLFTDGRGEPWHTGTTRAVAREIAVACGEDPHEFGASSFRSGGATDAREVLGSESADVIQQRGRWSTDVALIYQRALLSTQLDASGLLGGAHSADMEAVCIGWSQPRNF